MASSSLRSILSFPLPLSHPHKPNPKPFTIRCGPRDKRGPLMKGRILSTEAIHAVQSLKRSPQNDAVLSRLLKFDLLAVFTELLRQDRTELAVKVFAVIKSEPWYTPDLSIHAALVSALARKHKSVEITGLIDGLCENDFAADDNNKGLVMLIKAVINAGEVESTVRIYRMMRRSGWEPRCAEDDYVVGVLSSGLRRLGEESVANEICSEFGRASV